MGISKEKRHELDPPHSRRSRDGVHTIFYDFDARTVVASENEHHIHELC